MRIFVFVLSACLALSWTNMAVSQGFIEHLSTPVLQRGAVTRVTVYGTEVAAPVGLWTSLPAELIRAKVEATAVSVTNSPGAASTLQHSTRAEATLDIEVSPIAPLGLYGLRLATESGLSNVHLFLIDELPVSFRDRQLPVNGVQPVKLPASITAPCQPAAIDRYAIDVQAGQRVAFEVIGNRLGKDYDPLIQIRNSAGAVVAQHDNSVGLFFDLRFAHTFTSAGTYTVEVQDSRFEGHPSWHYVLRMGDFPEARMSVPSAIRPNESSTLTFPQIPGWQFPMKIDAAQTPLARGFAEIRTSDHSLATWIPLAVTDLQTQIEVEPNNSLQAATPVTVPSTLNGALLKPGESDFYRFDLVQGQKVQFQGCSKVIGSAADLELILFDADGREVRRTDDTDNEEGRFTFAAGKAGPHCLQVRDVAHDGGPEYAYRVDVRAGGPEFQLAAEVSEIAVPQGNYQSLPIKITRNEFAGEIHLELRGAPAGVTLEPTVIPVNASEFVSRIVAAPDTALGLGTLQIIGTAKLEGNAILQARVTTRPLIDRQLRNVDLILYALREDQTNLPPSLTDQIALLVTQPSPFQIELPEALVHLTRFQTAQFPIVTSRKPGFTGPLTFEVAGGQIGKESEERNQIYARFSPSAVEQSTVTGTFYNRILTNLAKHRVNLTAVGEVDGRRVQLIRTFTLDVRSAFQPTYEALQASVEPGGRYRVRIHANRVSTFDGALTFTLGPHPNFKVPETVEVPPGQSMIEVEIQADPKVNFGRHDLRVQVAGFVNKYEESLNLPNIQIEVKQPEAKKQ